MTVIANELMVGDLVVITNARGGTYYRNWKGEYHNAPLASIEPIPITPEFLIRNGFVKQEGGDYLLKLARGLSDGYWGRWVRVAFYDDNLVIDVESEPEKSKGTRKVHLTTCPYVHQLQQACRLCGMKIDWKL
jgi:hypothetical protein